MNKEEVIKEIGIENIDKFNTFMLGQTVEIIDGKIDYYNCDVQTFKNINKIKNDTNVLEDEQ